jgi:hypothetical protein
VAATLSAHVTKPAKELAKVTVSNIRIALACHQPFKRPFPIAHRIALKPKRLGYAKEIALCLAGATVHRA